MSVSDHALKTSVSCFWARFVSVPLDGELCPFASKVNRITRCLLVQQKEWSITDKLSENRTFRCRDTSLALPLHGRSYHA